MGFISTDFILKTTQFYSEAKASKEILLREGLGSRLRQDISKFFHLKALKQELKTNFFVIISVFCLKRPDFEYNIGILGIVNTILKVFSVECDAFVAFSYILENLYPKV
jgi:hypothetical protein